MRWQMADGRIVSPAEFIPVAEDTGLIVSIGNWALLEALTQLRTWIDEGVCSRSATMSVNVSPRQLRDPSLISAVSEALLPLRRPASQRVARGHRERDDQRARSGPRRPPPVAGS